MSANDRKNTVKTFYADNMPLTDIAIRVKEPPTLVADDINSFVEKEMIREEDVLKDSDYKKMKKIFESLPEVNQFVHMWESIPLSFSREKVKIAWRRFQKENI